MNPHVCTGGQGWVQAKLTPRNFWKRTAKFGSHSSPVPEGWTCVRKRTDIAEPRHTSASTTRWILEPADHVLWLIYLFDINFCFLQAPCYLAIYFPIVSSKKTLKDLERRNTTGRASWKAENQQGEVNSPIKQRTGWVASPCCTSPACKRRFRKSSEFAERSSRALLRDFNDTLRIASFIFKTVW